MNSPDKLQAMFLEIEESLKKLHHNLQSTRDSLTSSDVTSCSDIDDDGEPLPQAEESVIEESLNNTEGSKCNIHTYKKKLPCELQAILLEKEENSKKFHQQSTRDSLTDSDVTNCSYIENNEKPLSNAEESAIEECLNDTEGSLSNIDLKIFDDVSDDLQVHRIKKTRGQRTSERMIVDFGGNTTDYDSSLDEAEALKKSSLAETSLDKQISMIRKTGKINSQAESNKIVRKRVVLENMLKRRKKLDKYFKEFKYNKYFGLNSPKNIRKMIRRKRKNSPPMRKNDKTHIYSFFSAMADLVSTFPEDYVVKAKQNVNIVLEDMIDKLKEWLNNEDPTNPTHGFVFNHFDYRLIQDKLAKLQDIN